MHPLPAILNHGVHVALCSDDPSAFGNMGLSFDFFQVRLAASVPSALLIQERCVTGLRRERGEHDRNTARVRVGQHQGTSASMRSRAHPTICGLTCSLRPTIIQFSSLDDEERQYAFAALERRWTVFVKYVLDTYGGNFGSASQ